MWFRIISSSMNSLLIPLLTAFCVSQHFLISFSSSDLTRIVDCIWLISKSTCPVSANFSGLLSKQEALQSSGAAVSTLFSHGHSGVSSYVSALTASLSEQTQYFQFCFYFLNFIILMLHGNGTSVLYTNDNVHSGQTLTPVP